MATPNKPGSANLLSSGQTVPARTGVGSTVHHMASTPSGIQGVSTARTTATPFANLQQGILAMSMQANQKAAASTGQTGLRPGVPLLTSRVQTGLGPSPRKKIKVEEVEPATEEIAVSRKLILEERLSQMHEIKQSYINHLTECFFLQQGGQMMDFYQWRKKPTPQLLHFLKSGMLDSDDEEDALLKYLPDRRSLDSEVKVSSVGGVLPASTPVATSTTLPASVAALSQQGPDLSRVPGGRHGMVYGHVHPSLHSAPVPIALPPVHTSPTAGTGIGRGATISSGTSNLLSGSTIHRSVSESRLSTLTAQATKTVMTASASGSAVKKTPPGSPGRQRQNSFDGTNIKGISTQEAIVERAKQEAQVMSRVAELRKDGLWSSRRLPKVQEPPRNKAHWDYLLEEMQWLAADFQQERKWKKTCARKIAKMVQKHFQDIEQKELRAEKEETMKLKRTAGQLAKMVKEFWSNIEKVVQYKQNSRLDEKRKKAMDLHLNFIVDQTEKFSSWLSEGLTGQTSNPGSLNTTPASSLAGDEEFKPCESETDDEETIDKDEEGIDEAETRDEVAALQKESELPLDQLIESLPKEILEKPASFDDLDEQTEGKGADKTKKPDDDFSAESEESDLEETIDEQEEHEDKKEQQKELDELKDEGEMTIDELRAKYAAAYEMEMPADSGEESTDIDQSEEEEVESDEEEEEEEEEMEEDVDVEGGEDVGLEALVEEQEEKPQEVKTEGDASQPKDERDKHLTDIAAQAASLQPKGYTLESTEVKTKVPFLIRHTLREYQHVGLDWLATMYEKRLNGILADEMGLGKTIQTIALLAHLACEKGIWGPHLIVVPTSVMLNWEMEIKKWCPSFKILTYYGSQKERKQKRMGWTKTNAFHICITSYKLVIQDHQSFRRKKWKYLILDEAQNIKNFKSQRWQTLLNFNSMRRLLLTGTPLQNSLMELWSLMHFLMPNVFQSHKDFKEWFANPLTGMIEGSHEYNESLIRRLHKVLRPFLLRRLKDDVEKQMPKKYEHIVMCHLSKRQRFLYDEFMAQGKTRETLASGHFMSVINILMQLRKVCNHPSLFDPRPIVSPFQMQGLTYHTASEVLRVVSENPLDKLDLHRFPGLADMERDLPAFIAHRVRKLQTGRKLIQEIDIAAPPLARPPVGKLKMNAIRSVSPAIQTGRASPMVSSRSSSPAPSSLTLPGSTSSSILSTSVTSVTTSSAVTVVSSTSSQPTAPASSQPITVQIQHTDQGTRLVVPSGQLSSLPGFIQIVQTSTGQHLIATSAPSVASTVTSATVVVNGSPVVTMATSSARTVVSTTTSQVKMSAGIQSTTTPQTATVAGLNKPVMRVSPMATSQKHTNGDELGFTSASKPVTKVTYSSQILKHWEKLKIDKKKRDPFFLEPVYDQEQQWRRERLQFISHTNYQHCEVKPVYGQDLREAIDIFRDPYLSKTYRNRDTKLWNGPGYIHCQCAKLCPNPHHPKYVWNQTKVLSDICHSPEQYLEEMEALLDRFVFVIPTVQAPRIQLHLSHLQPSFRRDEAYREYMLRHELSPRAANYHQISTRMTVQFPELRLIQYDCGKLQTLDILLRRLKSGDHRVLIFTQMTRMLDILESFLNYHGHRYLRLDGTTKVEQRQLLMDRFNADRRIFVFILSTRSGGIGVNLTGADTVIFYDSDWNPTMDAQAQDRCHRIGQTRDVHIYRLVSEKTVEENILKKANQKRMLGDMAIEGGNFTTAFFKQNTISELFSEPSGLESLVKEKEQEEREKREKEEKAEKERKAEKDKQDRIALQQFEKALAENEDETDVVAIEQVKAEQKAELAEFDENIPWDEKEAELREEESHVEQELAMLHNELTPIERYAVQFTEEQMDPVNQEELLVAEEDIEAAKKDWELNRLKALKEEEERRAEMEEDEMLYTYSRDDAYQQVFLSDLDKEQMPLWSPPTPPHDDNDVYIDETLFFLFEPTVMPETQLPPVYVKKEKKKIKVESITTRKQKQRKEEQPRVPRSLFDRPTAQLLKLRREKMKMSQMKPYRPIQNLPPKPPMEQAPDHPEWLIHEDWALLQAVQNFFDVSLNLVIVNPAHTPNWDLVADVVNGCSRVYRSPKQCRLRYENVIIPREEGRIMYDMNPRKQKKQKGIYKMAKRCQAMKTGQIHSQDSNNGLTILYSLRFDSVKGIATKRPPTMRQTLVNPTLKNPKHASVLQENSIAYDNPLSPMQVAEIRAQRIQREKKQQQAAQQAASEQAAVTTPSVTAIQRTGQLASAQAQQVTAPTIVAMTTAVSAAQLATIVTAASSATVLTVSGTPLAQAALRQRAPLAVQEIGAAGTVVGPVRAQLQTSTTTVATALTPVQLAQRISAATTATGVQQQLQQATKTQQQFQILHNPNIFKQKPQQQHQAVLQQQQLKQRPLTLPTALTQQQQQLRHLKGQVIPGQKTVIAQQLVTSMAQPGQLKTATGTTRALTQEDLARLKQQQQQLNQQKVIAGQTVVGSSVAQIHQQTGQLQTPQIIAATQFQPVTQATLSKVPQTGPTLVKTVSAPPGSVTIPVTNVSINVSMPQKGAVGKVSQLNPQQMHLLQRKQIPVQKNLTQKVSAGPMLNAVQIIQQQGGRGLTVQQLNQLIKQHPQGLPQIIQTPTIIATVTQSQAQPQITKVISTTANIQASQMQTIPVSATTISGIVTSATSGSPVVTLSQVPSLNISSIAPGQSSVTASIVKPGSITSHDGVTTVQIHPVTTISQARATAVPQNVVVQPMQHVTVATPASATQHGASAQQVTLTTPVVMSQPVQVNVAGATPSQTQTSIQHLTVAHTPQAHVTVTAQRSSSQSASPMTVTVTPTAAVQQSQVLSQPGVTYVSGQTSSGTGQPATVSAEQAVTTILQQTQRQVNQAGIGQKNQSPRASQSNIPAQVSVVQVTMATTLPTSGQALPSGQAVHQTLLQGKTYSMRKRNQSQSK